MIKREIQTNNNSKTDRQTERMKMKFDGTQCGAARRIEDETTERRLR